MSLFSGVEAFVHTAEKRSFRAAAAGLGVTPTAVSKAVAGLERELGAKLLNRTTRSVSLTPEGAMYLRHCREAVDRLQAGRDLVTEAAQVAQGTLSVSMSSVLGRPVLAALPRLVDRHPRVELRLSFDDRAVNLVQDEVDVALRIGDLPDSSLVGRRLRRSRWVTLASPAYLARAEPLRSCDDLARHVRLLFVGPSGVNEWTFVGGLAPRAGRRLSLDHGDLLLDAAKAGLGLCQVFDFMAEAPVRRGELVEVLRDRSAPGPGVYALCLPGRQAVPKIRAFVEFAYEALGG
jgi:LysR family transcriptional regulator, regulator for bpeEF and oprC